MNVLDLDAVAKELDEFHDVARGAFLARDIDAYRELFSEVTVHSF